MMSTSESSNSGGNVVLSFTLGIDLIVYLARICFSLTVIGVGFWRLAGGIALRARFLILILSSNVTDFYLSGSPSEFDS